MHGLTPEVTPQIACLLGAETGYNGSADYQSLRHARLTAGKT